MFRELCDIRVPEDGIIFSAETATAAKIKEEPAVRRRPHQIPRPAPNVRIPIQVDVGFGDAVNPSLLDYPTLLPLPAPRIQAYPMNSVIAEKLEAIVSLGMLNSRTKTFLIFGSLRKHSRSPRERWGMQSVLRLSGAPRGSALTVWPSCLLTCLAIRRRKRSGGRSCKEPASKCPTPSPPWSSRFDSFSRLPGGP